MKISALKTNRLIVTLILGVGLLATTTLTAQTALSNLGQTTAGGSYTAGGHINGFSFGQAVNFTTGSSAVNFTGATFLFVLVTPYAADTGFHATLYSGFSTSGPTGLPLATLSGSTAPALSGTPTTFSYTTTPIQLAANTTYWLQVDTFGSGTTNTEIGWSATSNVGGIDAGELPGWKYYDGTPAGYTVYFTNNGGVSWSSGFSGTTFPQFSVQYSAVPEPATDAAFLGLAAVGLVGWRRRRPARG